MVHVFKSEVRLWKPFPLLFCSAVTNAAQKTQTQLRKIRKQSCTVFGNLCVYKPSAPQKKPSARNLIFGRSLPICGASCATNTFCKTFQMSASFF